MGFSPQLLVLALFFFRMILKCLCSFYLPVIWANVCAWLGLMPSYLCSTGAGAHFLQYDWSSCPFIGLWLELLSSNWSLIGACAQLLVFDWSIVPSYWSLIGALCPVTGLWLEPVSSYWSLIGALCPVTGLWLEPVPSYLSVIWACFQSLVCNWNLFPVTCL